MARAWLFILLPLLWVQSSLAQIGIFTNPSLGESQTYAVGSPVNISWSNVEDYTILSLGVFQEDGNGFVSWLISDSLGTPTAFQWIVSDLVFTPDDSTLFQFYIVNGTDFGLPFASGPFRIVQQTTSSSSTSSKSAPYSSTPLATPATSSTPSVITVTAQPTASATTSATPTPSSNPLSSGAKAGIGIGVAFLLIAVGGVVAWFVLRARRHKAPEKNRSGADGTDKIYAGESSTGSKAISPVSNGGVETHHLAELEGVWREGRPRAEL